MKKMHWPSNPIAPSHELRELRSMHDAVSSFNQIAPPPPPPAMGSPAGADTTYPQWRAHRSSNLPMSAVPGRGSTPAQPDNMHRTSEHHKHVSIACSPITPSPMPLASSQQRGNTGCTSETLLPSTSLDAASDHSPCSTIPPVSRSQDLHLIQQLIRIH